MIITQEQQKQGQELFSLLVSKAHENNNFKTKLIKNPKDTIKEVMGQKLNFDDHVSVIVEDQMNTDIIYLNIPKKVDLNDFELTQDQLDAVSGGEHSGSWNPIYNAGFYAHKGLHELDMYLGRLFFS